MKTQNKHYLDGLDEDLKQALLSQLRILWTHTSTALEGNSLTLGETQQVLLEGLTISGKPLKDHNEVVGHARALDLMDSLLKLSKPIAKEDLFALHKAVQTENVMDAYHPIGQWKNSPNSSIVVLDEKQAINDTYALPQNVPNLMELWLKYLNESLKDDIDPFDSYVRLHASFVRIHPFADGNGRLARLVANIPVLHAGEPPVIIQRTHRSQYIQTLARWQLSIGRAELGRDIVIDNDELSLFKTFCREEWQESKVLVERARDTQQKRSSSE